MSKLWPKLTFRYFKFNLFILVFVLFICCNGVNACKYIIYANIDNNSIVGPKTVVSIYERRD